MIREALATGARPVPSIKVKCRSTVTSAGAAKAYNRLKLRIRRFILG
jgi:hypothetical protein